MTNQLDFAIIEAFKVAVEHALKNTRTRHFGCSILVDGKFHSVVSNNMEKHAEINALDTLLDGKDLQCFE